MMDDQKQKQNKELDTFFKWSGWTGDIKVDDSTTYVEIPTPEGWKCPRANCPTDWYHEHTTYGALNKKTE